MEGIVNLSVNGEGIRVETIGNATLYLGDCRDVAIDDASIDMIFTDPPYGHNNNNGDLIHRREVALGRLPSGADLPQGRAIANDGAVETAEVVSWLWSASERMLRPGSCCCCCCGGGGPNPQFARWSLQMDEHLDFKQMVIWDKGPMGMGWHYRRSYETVLVGQRRGAACKWYDETNAIENVIRPGNFGIRKIIPSKDQHPTPKPPELAARFIKLHSVEGDTVLDPFMGGGSTAKAALLLGRKFIGIEVDPRWFEMACEVAEETQSKQKMFA